MRFACLPCLCLLLWTGPWAIGASTSFVYAPNDLRCLDKSHPVGTDDHPFFGWWVQDPNTHEIQTAYQILVASSPAKLAANDGDLWDSGRVTSRLQNDVAYAGRSLAAATRYLWKVRTWDRNGHASPYSQPAAFDTGLFQSRDWSPATWIKRDTTDRDDYTYYRKKFTLPDKTVQRAIVYVTAVHTYDLTLNGQRVGQGPAFQYPQYQYYNAYDVTTDIQAHADNLLACLTHWYGGGQGRPTSQRGFLLKLVIEWSDGSSTVIGTDASWKQTRDTAWNVTHPQRRNGEGVGYIDHIDAHNIIPDWNTLSFNDTNWSDAVVIGAPPIKPWTEPLQPDLTRVIEQTITPIEVIDLGQGTYVIDLGQVYAGVPSISFSGGPPGDVVSIRGGYTLADDGTVSTRTTQHTDMSYRFILNGNTARFQPRVYLGMRYIQVDGSPCILTPDNVKFITRHYELDPTRSSFTSSNTMLNRVWHLMKHSLLLGCQEEFVDTPTREKGGFLGDSWNQAVPAMTTMGDRTMNRRVLLEFLDSQDQYWPDGRLNAVYPNVDHARDIPDYTECYLVWAWDYYMQTGNRLFLLHNYPRLKKVADYVAHYRNPSTGLIENLAGGSGPYLHGIIDWPPQSRYGYDMKTAARTVINAYAYADFSVIARIATVLGLNTDHDTYQARANTLRTAINTHLINDQGVYIDGLYDDGTPSPHVSQHANMMPLALGLVPDQDRQAVIQVVKDQHMSVGMVPLRWLPQALGRSDQGPHLIDLYTNPHWDGWAKIITLGGTATWESWDALTSGDSMSHPWGAVGLLGIEQYILGVSPLTPQYETVQIKPLDFADKLTSAAGTLPTDRGDITVTWQRTAKRYTLKVTLPDNMTAQVYVPKCGEEGNRITLDGQTVTAHAEGHYLYVENIGSGQHTLVRSIP